MTRYLCLLLCLYCPLAWSEPLALDVKTAVVTLQNGDMVAVKEGCWLATQTCIDAARREVAAKTEVKKLEESTMDGPTLAVVTAIVVTALATGYAVGRLGK